MRYFKEVPFWKLALLNLIVGSIMSVSFSIAWMIMNPLICLDRSCSEVTVAEYIIAILIYLVIVFVGCTANVIMWRKYKKSHPMSYSKSFSINSILKMIGSLAIFTIGLFTIYFIFMVFTSIFRLWIRS